MGFTLNLYTTSSDPRQVTKSLSEVANSVAINPTASLDVLSPTIVLGYNETYLRANYCYIPFLKRYYYINNIALEIGKQITLNCSIDVLMTYDSSLRNCNACVIRNEGIGKPTNIVDTQLPIIQGKYNISAQIFPNSPLDTDVLTNTILITLGG